ncbi:C-X-C chemokine receptor type 2-like [Amblyraja radiata]|uniref:C-X-C chemokine receptor type 2-like n=1 Tax=Amblyraja radiata TaxID=386614 RepID=UPI001403D315|nr:C-X-C chemokine receptor type 2-like [Amblyraja radiata]
MEEMMGQSFNLDDHDFDNIFENYSYEYDVEPGVSPCIPLVKKSLNVMLAAVYSLVCLLAVTGNVLVLVVILHNRRSISSTDVYLLHLATADLLFALTLPFWAVDAVSGWVFGDAMCKVISMLQEVNFYSGILLLACISVDRYLAIVRSVQSHGHKRPWMVKLVCAVVWFVALLLSLPVLYKGELIHDRRTLCYEILDGQSADIWRTATRFLRHVMGFLVPLAAMVFCYSVTVWKLCQTKGFQKQKAMKVIIAVVLAFLACWLPHNVTVLVDTLMRSKLIEDSCAKRDHLDRALSATQTLGFTHSCINPILYAFIGVKFRRNLVKILAKSGIVRRAIISKYRRSMSSISESGLISTAIYMDHDVNVRATK